MSVIPRHLRFRDSAIRQLSAEGTRAQIPSALESRPQGGGTFPSLTTVAPASPRLTENPVHRPVVRQTAGGSSSGDSAPDCGPRETASRGYFPARHAKSGDAAG